MPAQYREKLCIEKRGQAERRGAALGSMLLRCMQRGGRTTEPGSSPSHCREGRQMPSASFYARQKRGSRSEPYAATPSARLADRRVEAKEQRKKQKVVRTGNARQQRSRRTKCHRTVKAAQAHSLRRGAATLPTVSSCSPKGRGRHCWQAGVEVGVKGEVVGRGRQGR